MTYTMLKAISYWKVKNLETRKTLKLRKTIISLLLIIIIEIKMKAS